MRLGSHTIVVVEAGTKASNYGNTQTLDWSSATRTTIEGCSVQPSDAPEFTVDRDSTLTRWVAYVPAGISISATARIEYAGDTYDIDGDPQSWDFGALAHQVINLRRSHDEDV